MFFVAFLIQFLTMPRAKEPFEHPVQYAVFSNLLYCTCISAATRDPTNKFRGRRTEPQIW